MLKTRLKELLRRWLVPELGEAKSEAPTAAPIRLEMPPPPAPQFQELEALLRMADWLSKRDAQKRQDGYSEALTAVADTFGEQLGWEVRPGAPH